MISGIRRGSQKWWGKPPPKSLSIAKSLSAKLLFLKHRYLEYADCFSTPRKCSQSGWCSVAMKRRFLSPKNSWMWKRAAGRAAALRPIRTVSLLLNVRQPSFPKMPLAQGARIRGSKHWSGQMNSPGLSEGAGELGFPSPECQSKLWLYPSLFTGMHSELAAKFLKVAPWLLAS